MPTKAQEARMAAGIEGAKLHHARRLSAAHEGVVKALEAMLTDKTPWNLRTVAARAALKELEEASK